MRWCTRAGVHIDRAACAWLIVRFVDAAAEFSFVTDPDDLPVGATPFDMRGVDLGHHGGDCSFETILFRYDLTDPVVRAGAEREIVAEYLAAHEIVEATERDAEDLSPGDVAAAINGYRAVFDHLVTTRATADPELGAADEA